MNLKKTIFSGKDRWDERRENENGSYDLILFSGYPKYDLIVYSVIITSNWWADHIWLLSNCVCSEYSNFLVSFDHFTQLNNINLKMQMLSSHTAVPFKQFKWVLTKCKFQYIKGTQDKHIKYAGLIFQTLLKKRWYKSGVHRKYHANSLLYIIWESVQSVTISQIKHIWKISRRLDIKENFLKLSSFFVYSIWTSAVWFLQSRYLTSK